MKTAISLPDDLFIAAEKIQRKKKVSRSEFYATAIRWYVQHENMNGITNQLNKIYDDARVNSLDSEFLGAQMEVLEKDEWK
jgi:metal-responsive CopG/Arc/MetJ family transcriptional regulator